MGSNTKFTLKKKGSFISYDATDIIKYVNELDAFVSDKNLSKLARKVSAPFVIKDINNHFEKMAGPQGKWPEWSIPYKERMIKLGKGNNFILRDTRDLEKGMIPGNYRVGRGNVVWFNTVEYARRHDEGTGGMPRRSFMWLSEKALDKIGSAALELAFNLGK